MPDLTRILISGAGGRMGRTVARLAGEEPSVQLVGGLDRSDQTAADGAEIPIADPSSGAELLSNADVVIDFSAPEFLRRVLDVADAAGASAAFVVGTTGLETDDRRRLEEAAERVPVLTAANFSVGVNLLLALAERAAASLGAEYDIEIVEAHHRRKEDAPSGTALALGEAVATGRGLKLPEVQRDGRSGRPGARTQDEIGFHAIRGGDVIGDHQVHFIGELERIELTHRASNRALFAAGALRAARWLNGRQPGLYSMRDVLDL